MINHLFNFINKINYALINKKKEINVLVNLTVLQLIKLLYQLKIISFYYIYKENNCVLNSRITINIKNKRQLVTISRPSNRIYVTFKQLHFIHRFTNKTHGHTCLSFTNKGLLSSAQALRNKLGGELICLL